MPTKREVLYLGAGIGLGVYIPKKLPNLSIVKLTKYSMEIWKSYSRLQKVLVEEYYRIDEAIAEEESLLKLFNPNVLGSETLHVSFSVKDDGHKRMMHMNIKGDGIRKKDT